MSAATYEASQKNLKEKYVRNGMALGNCNLGECVQCQKHTNGQLAYFLKEQ